MNARLMTAVAAVLVCAVAAIAQQVSFVAYGGYAHTSTCPIVARVSTTSISATEVSRYLPCASCRPDDRITGLKAQAAGRPAAANIGVFYITTSSDYHAADCPLQQNGHKLVPMTLAEAERRELKPCHLCRPNTKPPVSTYLADVAARAAADKERAAAAATAKRNAEEAAATAKRKTEEARLAGALPTISEAMARKFAVDASAASKDDVNRFRTLFASHVAKVAPDYSGAVFVHSSSALLITVMGPVSRYGFSVSERVRKFEANPTSVPWDGTYTVSVYPRLIDAPNIEKVILQRNGVTVSPTTSGLKPSVKVTAMNAKAVINEGDITFPASAFAPAPKLELRLIAVPTSGDNIIHVFTNKELHSIR